MKFCLLVPGCLRELHLMPCINLKDEAPKVSLTLGLLRLTMVIMLTFWSIAPCWAQEVGAGDAAHFLREGIGARACALGGAYVALASDTSAAYWNPAGLVQTQSFRFGGTYERRYGGLVEFQHLSGAISWHSLGVGLLWVSSDMYSVAFVSISGDFGDLSLGCTGKLYTFASGLQNAYGMGFDIGILYSASLGKYSLAIGLVSSDLGWTTIRWRGSGLDMVDHVAWVNKVGVALNSEGLFGPWLWTADLELAFRRPPRPGEIDYFPKTLQISLDLGVELWFQFVALRGGLADIQFNKISGITLRPTLGMGLRIGNIAFDAAWATSPVGYTYLLSMEVAF